ncbi:hypothetical protein BELL_0117g00010 [Botrytis elliptica]|uniref:Uncharacterized protein n=1 Tax=Botrytis elliptica TaxID=278938 RepID=A0A4Z1K778_9HELO|nr:hypothetical protein BELL_0117g00010 [Botrytis elliptica]
MVKKDTYFPAEKSIGVISELPAPTHLNNSQALQERVEDAISDMIDPSHQHSNNSASTSSATFPAAY